MNISGLKIYIIATAIYLGIGIYGIYTLVQINSTLERVNAALVQIDGKIK